MNQEKMPMNESSELPQVSGQHIDMLNETQASKKVEQGAVSSASPVNSPDPSVVSQQNASIQGQSSQLPGSQPKTQIPTPSIADDEDLIEKEWVESAKRIVAQTKGDPHAQSEGISAIKDDYKKKRFNIDNDLGKAS